MYFRLNWSAVFRLTEVVSRLTQTYCKSQFFNLQHAKHTCQFTNGQEQIGLFDIGEIVLAV